MVFQHAKASRGKVRLGLAVLASADCLPVACASVAGALLAIAVGAEEDADGSHGRRGGTIVIGRSVSRARLPWRLEQLQVRESFRKRRPVRPQRILPL
jgi:hypothetical protein